MDKGKEVQDVYTESDGTEEEVQVDDVAAQVQARTTGVKRWVVDLDLPPEERWREVVAFHKPDLLAVAQLVRSELAQVLLPAYSVASLISLI
jgi:hypothetical protein